MATAMKTIAIPVTAEGYTEEEALAALAELIFERCQANPNGKVITVSHGIKKRHQETGSTILLAHALIIAETPA